MARFEEVLPELKNGNKIKLAKWKPGCYIGVNESGDIFFEGSQYFDISYILREDWEVITDEMIEMNKAIGSVCYFWDDDESAGTYDVLGKTKINQQTHQLSYFPKGCDTLCFCHCRLLTNEEKGL